MVQKICSLLLLFLLASCSHTGEFLTVDKDGWFNMKGYGLLYCVSNEQKAVLKQNISEQKEAVSIDGKIAKPVCYEPTKIDGEGHLYWNMDGNKSPLFY